MSAPVGVVPAAGTGSRLWPYRAPKELIQVGYTVAGSEHDEPRLIPRATVEYVLSAMRAGGVSSVFVVLSALKWDVFRYLGSGRSLGLHLSYLCQEEPLGLAHAIGLARPFTEGRTVCLGLPDTIVEPADCCAQLLAFHRDNAAHLSLGLFEVADPRQFGVVTMHTDGRHVRAIDDKPRVPRSNLVWGLAVWSDEFAELLQAFVAEPVSAGSEPVLGDAFTMAIEGGLRVLALRFENGSFHDIGTPVSLARARLVFDRHDVA
jgi:glucose-1-phosphate thymidylyltransferase